MPLFSIIIPTFNSEKTLKRCLESIRFQLYQNIEVIIFDNCSTDNTLKIINQYSKYLKNLKFYSEPDQNHYDAINKAIKISKGEWIYILGSDDELASNNVLKDVYLVTKKVKNTLVLYGKVNLMNNSKLLKVIGRPWFISRFFFTSYMSIPHQGVFHHKNLFKYYGFFDYKFNFAGDYDLILRYLIDNNPYYMNLIIANYSAAGGSYNKNNYKFIVNEWRKAQLNSKIRIPRIFWLIALLKSNFF